MVTFLKSQLNDQIKGSLFFSQVRKARRQQIEQSKLDYKWGEPDYKIYPSALSFTMCPKEYILGLEKFNGIDNLDAIYRVRRGSAVHEELQRDILSSDKLYSRVDLEKAMPQGMVNKMQPMWPEVPFWDEESGISGRLDCLMDWKGPIPVEIKTTSVPIDQWEKACEHRLPMPYHRCQGAVYCYMLNKLGYVREPITRFVLAYINLMAPPGEQKAEKEYIIEYTQDLHEMVDGLVKELIIQRNSYLSQVHGFGGEVPCTYSLCKKKHEFEGELSFEV